MLKLARTKLVNINCWQPVNQGFVAIECTEVILSKMLLSKGKLGYHDVFKCSLVHFICCSEKLEYIQLVDGYVFTVNSYRHHRGNYEHSIKKL